MSLTLSCLQGIVNRSEPRLFLSYDHYDDLWLEWLRVRGDIEEFRWVDIGEIFQRFLPELRCKFIIDTTLPASINVATMLAGVFNGLVATAETAYQFDLPMELPPANGRNGLDLRGFNWRRDLHAYQWVYGEIGRLLSRQAMAFADPYALPFRDYLVAFRIPILWIASPKDEKRNLAALSNEELDFSRSIMMKWPANIPCMGWPGNSTGPEVGIGEEVGVDLASRCAKFQICTGYDGYSPAASNTSVHSGTSAELRQTSAPRIPLQRDKVYFSFIRSDGDGWNFQRHYYRKLFDEAQKNPETPPIGWQLGPTAIDGQPDILDYYYRHARPQDYFVNALTGIGYIREEDYANNFSSAEHSKIWCEYLKMSSFYRGRIDSSCISTFGEMSPGQLADIAMIPGIKGIFAGYGRSDRSVSTEPVLEVCGVPVFKAINRNFGELTLTPAGRRNAEAFTIKEITLRTPSARPAFLHVFLGNWFTHIEMALNITKALGTEYIAVRPDQLTQLYQESRNE